MRNIICYDVFGYPCVLDESWTCNDVCDLEAKFETPILIKYIT